VNYYTKSYSKLFESLSLSHSKEDAMSLFVGGEFQKFGYLEERILRSIGLESNWNIVDVGCGSGRLALRLKDFLEGQYLGTDLVDDVLDYANSIVNRPNFSFQKVEDCTIPSTENFADVIVFFSVFTHLYDEDCFRYLKESKRVSKNNGLIVLSFFDFEEPNHWWVFDQALKNPDPTKVPSAFLSKSALRKWCVVLHLEIESIYAGSKAWIPIEKDIGFDDESNTTGKAEFGQSVAVIRVSS